MDIARAFGAPMRDPKWIGKIALGVLFSLIPIVNLAVAGWAIKYIHDYAVGNRDRLPEWSDFGGHWTRGLTFAFASWIYYLPAGLILILGSGLGGLSMGAMTDPSVALAGLLGSVGLALLFAGLYMLVASFLVEAARANYAVYGTFGAAFGLKEILARVRANFGVYLTAWLMGIVVVFAAMAAGGFIGFLLGLIPVLGWIVELLLLPVFMGMGLTAGAISSAFIGEYAGIAYASAPGMSVSPTSQFPAVGADWGAPPTAPPTSPRMGSMPGTLDPEAGGGRAAIAAAVARATPPSATRQDTPTVPPMPISPERSIAPELAAPVVPAAATSTPVTVMNPEAIIAPPTPASEEHAVPEPQPEPAPEPMPAPEPEPTPEPAPEPMPEPEPAPAPEPTPEPAPAPAPMPEPTPAAPVAPVPSVTSQVAVPVPQPTRTIIRYELHKESGPGPSGESWNLPVADVRIGRDEACFVSLSDGKASRVHAVLSVGQNSVLVTDTGSSNGTSVNGTKLGAEGVPVNTGDTIRIGDTTLIVREAR